MSAGAVSMLSQVGTAKAAGEASDGDGGGGGGGGVISTMAGEVLNPLGKAVDIYSKIDEMITSKRTAAESKRRFDQQFQENVRQYGLDFALKDYATRQGISLQKVQMMFNADQQKNQNALTAENLKTSALGRGIQQKQFDWMKEDRAKNTAFKKALQKGLATGMLGG